VGQKNGSCGGVEKASCAGFWPCFGAKITARVPVARGFSTGPLSPFIPCLMNANTPAACITPAKNLEKMAHKRYTECL